MKIFHSPLRRLKHAVALAGVAAAAVLLTGTALSDVKKTEMVVLTTDFGEMTIRLYDETPLHKENFLKLVREGFYDGLLFHRVINGFMVQGGDPDSRDAGPNVQLGRGGPGYTVPAEIEPDFIHKKGALAAARQGDAVNPEKASSGSQFYVVHGTQADTAALRRSGSVDYTAEQLEAYARLGGTPHLDGGYTVFGEVVDGLNVIDSIAAQPVNRRTNRPLNDLNMSAKIVKKKWK